MKRSGSRPVAQLAVIAILAAMALLAVSPPAEACACGGAVNERGESMRIVGETALVTQHAGSETIVMSLSARSDAARAGLLVPTPTPAKPELADNSLFTDLAKQVAPRTRVRHHLFGPPALFHSDSGGPERGGSQAAAPGGVRVLERVDLGPLQAVSLTAGNASDLHSWLDKRGFVMSPEFESLVTPYLKQGWAFTAMTLTAEGKSLNGALPPVSLTFASDKLVYPMRMSRGAKETQHVTTYVLSDHRVKRTDPTAGQGELRTDYAATVRPSLMTSADLKRLSTGRPWLTEFRQTFDRPGTQVRSDFTFGPAAHETPRISYNYKDEYFVPIDVAVLLVILLLAVTGVVVLRVRRQRSS